ncbi:hypothetical protein IG631_17144 [Alternaria alternata]|nr:hypothetical protein IG631_17144 [Alternaria alternata]
MFRKTKRKLSARECRSLPEQPRHDFANCNARREPAVEPTEKVYKALPNITRAVSSQTPRGVSTVHPQRVLRESPSQEAGNQPSLPITISCIYTRGVLPDCMRGSSENTDVASLAPALATDSAGDDPYDFLKSFDTVFLIDDSGSMAGRSWKDTAAALEKIATICTQRDADGIDIYFLNHPTNPIGVLPSQRNYGTSSEPINSSPCNMVPAAKALSQASTVDERTRKSLQPATQLVTDTISPAVDIPPTTRWRLVLLKALRSVSDLLQSHERMLLNSVGHRTSFLQMSLFVTSAAAQQYDTIPTPDWKQRAMAALTDALAQCAFSRSCMEPSTLIQRMERKDPTNLSALRSVSCTWFLCVATADVSSSVTEKTKVPAPSPRF